MLRGCLFTLLLWAALAGGYWYWFDQVFDPPGSWIGAIVAGFVAMCCLGALQNGARAWRDASQLGSARFGEHLVDGKIATVTGTIHPVGQPLAAPFSGTPCVICEYDLASQRRLASTEDNENSGSDYAGFLMVPSVIRTPMGEVRLLGFPILEDFGEVRCQGLASAVRAREFLTTHQFEDRTGAKFIKVLSVFSEIWSDDDGLVEKNFRMGNVSLDDLFPPELNESVARAVAEDPAALDQSPEVDVEDEEDDDELDEARLKAPSIPKLVEKRVPVGEQVCAIGIYDEMRRGLVPPPGSTKPNRLLRGSADVIEARLHGSMIRGLLGGLVAFAMLHVIIWGVMTLYRMSPDVIREQQTKAIQAVVHGQPEELEQLVHRGLDVNFKDSQGRTLLMHAQDPAITGWLIEHGADVNLADKSRETPLTLAARYGRTEIVGQLIAAKAGLDPRSSETGQTPLAEALAQGHAEAAELLRKAGAEE